MRRIAVVAVLACLFAVPASAVADKSAPGDGSLVVREGRGIVVVSAKGGIIGRIDSGRFTIDDPIEGDGKGPIVYGAERIRVVGETKTLYIGNDVHFYIGGLYGIRIVATGINLSAVGKGSATLTSDGFIDPGVYKVDDGPFRPLPDIPAKVQLGTG